MYEVVTPAKAGVQVANPGRYLIPAFAGMTETLDFIGPAIAGAHSTTTAVPLAVTISMPFFSPSTS